MLILELLRHVAAGPNSDNADRVTQALEHSSEREFLWAIEAGLGPLLHDATRGHDNRLHGERRSILLSSDLTARIKHGLRVHSAREVIDACAAVGAPVTLLKGISISEQYYPVGHLRNMSDLDVLLPGEMHPAVARELMSRGYSRAIDTLGEDHHHDVPLCDPTGTVWVELHTRLYPQSSGLLEGQTFQPATVLAHSVASVFHGLPVNRLSPEFQLAYMASSWMHDLTLFKVHPSFVTPLFDALFLLRSTGRNLEWESLAGLLDNMLARSSLLVMLTYLARRRLYTVPPDHDLSRQERLVGTLEGLAIHGMIDRYVVGGRYWDLPIPPPVPGRYNPGWQLRKRWLDRRANA